MKLLIWIVMSTLLVACVLQSTPGEITVIDQDSSHSENLMKDANCKRIEGIENEIHDDRKRGKNIKYSLLSVSFNQLTKDGFIMKETEVEISSFKELSFSEIHESVNYLTSEIKDGKEIDYYQSLDLFRIHLSHYGDRNDILLFNIGRSSFYGEQPKGHIFSVMEAYDKINHNVLLVEIDGDKQTKYWVHYKNLLDTVMTRREEYCCPSGWIEITEIPD
ncbi:hypothetical protein PQO03_01365 [Lentisphaera profundi]|uniref:Glutathione gamma-glutamylcysteinyltransferase n=1 Tax=Lentisphaera profundi TaxID=1658616 RepID=A0ABY7VRV6_9BACT|nr:hypothetical protein [Lentisphaera profundi]WDE96616.1 hypothetical protein PQO03_01365 [Lentisphaera profundi]